MNIVFYLFDICTFGIFQVFSVYLYFKNEVAIECPFG